MMHLIYDACPLPGKVLHNAFSLRKRMVDADILHLECVHPYGRIKPFHLIFNTDPLPGSSRYNAFCLFFSIFDSCYLCLECMKCNSVMEIHHLALYMRSLLLIVCDKLLFLFNSIAE